MTRFKPIRQFRVSEEVAEQLKQSILLGHFKSGDKLPAERDLAEEFKVSRVAIREALRKLENSGFIITRQGATGGAYVTDLTFEHLADAFLDLFLAEKITIPEMHQVRILVEPKVVQLAALKVTPEYVQRLEDAVEAEEPPTSSLSEDIERKQKMHFILAEMCGNRFLEALVGSLMKLTRRALEAVETDPSYMHSAELLYYLHPAGMHRPIVEAVLAGDPEAAAKAMENHVIEFGENLNKMEMNYRKKAL
ncbi:MAG: GntR family transcriptional regulator [Deltaproteobacteria bacterium RBG_13_52_11]|nr:MAG: GntR family transcriptional regulator [Deltaproteobacteria bacterium RBG_13_52_11]